MSTITQIIDLAQGRAPTCGQRRLICIDGPSGSGKTTLANDLSAALTQRGQPVAMVQLDDLYPGWEALPQTAEIVEPLLRRLAVGKPASYQSWDWHRGQPGTMRRIPSTGVVILEGVGAGARPWSDLTTVLVWVEHENALERAIARDGERLRPQLLRWHHDEAVLFEREQPWLRADIAVG